VAPIRAATAAMSLFLPILLLLSVAVTVARAQPGIPLGCTAVGDTRNQRNTVQMQPRRRPLFDDKFTSLSLHNIWQRGDKWQLVAPDSPRGRGGVNYNEFGDQWWTNPFNMSTPVPGGPRPAPLYQIDTNGLKLALLPTPSVVRSYIRSQCRCTNLKYVGALLNSSQTYLRKFGYVEMQVAVDRLPGFTFQADQEAQPMSPVWPPEIDFPVIYTDAGGVQWMKMEVHQKAGRTQTCATSSNEGFDASVMHTYGVNWQVDFITFYIDGAQVFQVATPTDGTYTDHPMYWYLLTGANYQQTSPTDPDPARLPAYAHVRYFRAYANLPQNLTGK
jgi:hypothetical protein